MSGQRSSGLLLLCLKSGRRPSSGRTDANFWHKVTCISDLSKSLLYLRLTFVLPLSFGVSSVVCTCTSRPLLASSYAPRLRPFKGLRHTCTSRPSPYSPRLRPFEGSRSTSPAFLVPLLHGHKIKGNPPYTLVSRRKLLSRETGNLPHGGGGVHEMDVIDVGAHLQQSSSSQRKLNLESKTQLPAAE